MFQSDYEESQVTIDWIVFFSSFVVVTALVGCVCGCRKDAEKDDWLGKEGKMKQLNTSFNSDEENEPHLNATGNKSNAANRLSTAKRSLPDIPNNDTPVSENTWEQPLVTASDNCSELYATVGEGPESGTYPYKGSKKRLAPSAPSTENSQSEATPPNSNVSHEYAKLSHPYARVKPVPPKGEVPHHASSSTVTQPSIELESSETTPGVQGGSETTLSSSTDQPVPPPRARRSSSQSNIYLGQNSSSRPSVHRLSNTHHSSSTSSSSSHLADTIAAAPAILGQISASQELPYITLPLPDNVRHNSMPSDLPAISAELETERPALPIQPEEIGGHFSGDSQDSGKGYTSISVREPLASIRAQISQEQRDRPPLQPQLQAQQSFQRRQQKLDPHYAIVSDDSDEMYAAIEDRQGNDMYAQVLPPPPTVDSLRNRVADNHSRQASSSSANSSVANVGSPKPEKRQANSPLPPPPMLQASTSTEDAPPPPRLEDMYAKVMKKKSLSAAIEPNVPELVEQPENEEIKGPSNSESRYDPSSSDSRYESIHPSSSDSRYESIPENLLEPNYESVTPATTIPNAGYARILRNPNDPGYEVVNSSAETPVDPNYEELRQAGSGVEPNYEQLNEVQSIYKSSTSSDDPNYELVGGVNEPPYELLSTEQSSASSGDILYATVNKPRK